MATTGTIDKSGNKLADGVLSGYGWNGFQITYSFPDEASDYGYAGERKTFTAVNLTVQNAVRRVLEDSSGIPADNSFSIEGFTNLDISLGGHETADIRFAESKKANPSAYAYMPIGGGEKPGDVWFGKNPDYDSPIVGNYAFATTLHETGHALGLKHGHQAAGYDRIKTELKGKFDSLEYSVMTYHSYPKMKENYYTNEEMGFPQTYMMADIRALQHMYGADYSANSGDTVYKWSPLSGETLINGVAAIQPGANRIFATIWDGNGNDTYDLSSYGGGVTVDLRPGRYSIFSNNQRVDLGAYDGSPQKHLANGNIYNALLAKDGGGIVSLASLIENAIGGWGRDKLIGNAADNQLTGGANRDTFFFREGSHDDTILDFSNSQDRINLATFDVKNFSRLVTLMQNEVGGVTIDFGDGDTLHIVGHSTTTLDKSDFIL